MGQKLDRVRRNTAPEINQQIDAQIRDNIQFYSKQDRQALDQRIRDLDTEWDIERFLITQASSIALTSLGLSVLHSRRWLALTGGVLGFLLMHGTQGWCPPVPVLRRYGFRTRGEIDREKFALKALRGDFDTLMQKHAGGATSAPRTQSVAGSV